MPIAHILTGANACFDSRVSGSADLRRPSAARLWRMVSAVSLAATISVRGFARAACCAPSTRAAVGVGSMAGLLVVALSPGAGTNACTTDAGAVAEDGIGVCARPTVAADATDVADAADVADVAGAADVVDAADVPDVNPEAADSCSASA